MTWVADRLIVTEGRGGRKYRASPAVLEVLSCAATPIPMTTLAKRARSGTGVVTALVRCGLLLPADQPQPVSAVWLAASTRKAMSSWQRRSSWREERTPMQ